VIKTKTQTVHLVTSSSKITKDELENAKRFVRNLDYKCSYFSSVMENHLGFAGTPESRSNEINRSLCTDADIIWAVRGGYGSVQVIDKVKYSKVKNKLFIGYSDFSLLLNVIHDKTGLITLHGPMPSKNISEYHDDSMNTLKKALSFENYSWSFGDENVLVPGKFKGDVVGGNLELFIRSLGTEYEFDSNGKVVFLEDNKVKGKNIYDMLEQLRLAGKFDKASGIVAGKFTNAKQPMKYVKDFFGDFDIPVLYDMDFGHEEPNLTFPIGAECTVDPSSEKVYFDFEGKHKPWSI